MKLFLFFSVFLPSVWGLNAQTLHLRIFNLRNTQGNLRIQFFDSQEHFDGKQPLFTKTVSKASSRNGTLTVSYSGVKPGTYGIAILDDENGNDRMDYGVLLPKEGFGFSDYYHTGMSQPDFKRFSFLLTASDKNIEIKVRYL